MASRRAGACALLVAVAFLTVAAAPGGARIDLPMAADAESRMDTVRRMTAAGQRQQVCLLLQDMIDDNPGVVWDGRAFVPARDFASRCIAALPADARAAYEALYGAAARRLLDEGLAERSETKLQEVADRYLNTGCSPRAVSALAALRMDRGEFDGALRVLRSALAVDPHLPAGRAIAVRELLCLARLGRRSEAEALVRRLREVGIDSVPIAGAERPLDALLADALPPSPAGPDAADSSSDLESGSLQATFVELPWPGEVDPQWPSIPSTQPIACDGSICVNRDDSVLSFDAQTAQLRWGSAPPGGVRELVRAIALRSPLDEDLLPLYLPVENVHHWRTFDIHGLSTVSCADGRIYAVRMDPLWQKFPAEPWTATQDNIRLVNELQCLDARDGTLVWSTLQVDGGALADRWFATAPAVRGSRAHVLSVRRGEVRAVCLDAASGHLLWDAPVGAVTGSQDGQRYAAEFFLADCGRPGVADGIAVFPTGRGLLAAFDALDGRPLWVAVYPRVDAGINRVGIQLGVPNGPWTPGPPAFARDLCIVAPPDSRHVAAFSLATGTAAWHAEFSDGVALLGVRGGRLYVQHQGVTCLDAATGDVVWRTPFDTPVTGLGGLGAAFAYVPQRQGVRTVDLASGKALPAVPWPPGIEANGNLLLDAGALVLCGPRQVAALRPSGDAPPAESAEPAEAAVALMEHVCEGGSAAEALSTYLMECRKAGSLPYPEPWGTASVWTHLAELVRAHCVANPELSAEWHRAYAEAIGRAARDANEPALIELARRAPFEHAQSGALLRLGELLEKAARPDDARRAYAGLLVSHADAPEAPAARAGLERLVGRDGAAYAGLLQGTPTPAALTHVPTAETAWEVRGIPVLPERGTGTRVPGKAFILQRTGVVCVDAATGEPAWTVPLMQGGAQDEAAPNPGDLPSRQIGWGLPAFRALLDRVVISLPALAFGAAISDGRPLWTHDVAALPASTNRRPLRRIELVRWALRGLPVPAAASLEHAPRQQTGARSSLLTCRIEPPSVLTALDPFSGDVLFRSDGTDARAGPRLPGNVRVALLTAAGDRLCVAGDKPPSLSVVEGRTGDVLAQWTLPPSLWQCSLAATPGGNVVLADIARVFYLDLRRMHLSASSAVGGGIDEMLHADDGLVVVRTLQGNAAALTDRGARSVNLGEADAGTAVWAVGEDKVVWTLEAAEVLRTLHYGSGRHFTGAGFALRAFRLPDGEPAWRADLQVAAPAIVGEPVRCGPLWLLAVAETDRVRLIGHDAGGGSRVFEVELPGSHDPQPVPLLIEGNRVIVGLGDRTVALTPGEEALPVPSPSHAAP